LNTELLHLISDKLKYEVSWKPLQVAAIRFVQPCGWHAIHLRKIRIQHDPLAMNGAGVRQNSPGIVLTPSLSSRRGSIIHRPTAKARYWICRMLIRKTRTVRLLYLLPGGEG